MNDSKFEQLCDQFEHAWSQGQSPRIEDFLPDAPAERASELLSNLLEIELEYRFGSESEPSEVDYQSRFPGQHGVIAQAFSEARRRLQPTEHHDTPANSISSAPSALDARPAPQSLGRYSIIQPIGKGGMGQVFLAEQTEPIQRRVALKVIQPALLEAHAGGHSEMFRARFEAERQALAIMEHPNIARVYEAGVYEGSPFLAMEFIDGVPISQYCDDGGLDVTDRVRIFSQACRAVQHAHTKGVIHRDIKPQNVLVTEVDGQPVVKVIDFGLARASEDTLRLSDNVVSTAAGAVLGTWAYMSPEQAQGQSRDVDTRSDVYSLGALLYELLTGIPPLLASSLREMDASQRLKAICEEEPPIPSRRAQDAADADTHASRRGSNPTRLSSVLKGDLDWIAMRALEKQRDRRYQSPQELEADIARHLRDEPVLAGPPSWVYRLQKMAKRNPLGTLLLASGAIVALTTIGFLYQRAETESARANEQTALASEQAALANEQTAHANEQAALASEQTALANEQSARAEEQKVRAELAERNLVSQLTSSLQLLSRDALDERLANIDRALDSSDLTKESRAAVAIYKFDLLVAVQRFEDAYQTCRNVEPSGPKQEASILFRQLLSEDDPAATSGVRSRLNELSEHLSAADRLFLEAIGVRAPRAQIPLLLDALDSDPSHFPSRYQLGLAYCLSGQTQKLRQFCEISRTVYPASPFFDILWGFGAAFDGDRVAVESAASRVQSKLSDADADQIRSVMEIILRLSQELRKLEYGMPNSLRPQTLLATLAQLQSVDFRSPTMRYLARQLNVSSDDGAELPASSVLFTRWTTATAQFMFGNRDAYESILNDIEAVSPIPNDAIFSYARSVLAFDKESWSEIIARQEEIVQRPSVIPALRSEVTYVMHMSRRGLYKQTKDPAVLTAAAEDLRSWLSQKPQWDGGRLNIAVDTALTAGDIALAERMVIGAQEKLDASDAAVLESRLRIHMKRQAYYPAIKLADEILEDQTWEQDHRVRKAAEQLREKAVSELKMFAAENL